MSSAALQLIVGGLTGDAPLDTAISRAILERVNSGELPATLQVGMPHQGVAFGKHDTLAPGFARAVAIAHDQGFDATVRIAGGRAVVFHPGTVRFAWTVPEDEPTRTMHARFETLAQATVTALAHFGVSAEVGELPDEYCAGRYSVHLTGGGKIMGVGQRLTRHAAQVGGMIVVSDAPKINAVLEPIYRELEIPFDPAQTGAVSDLRELGSESVALAFADALSPETRLVPSSVDTRTRTLAASLRTDHVPLHLHEGAEPP
jgi:lipoate-protein ligase A